MFHTTVFQDNCLTRETIEYCWPYGVLTQLLTIFQLHVYHDVSCIAGGNRGARRKPQNCIAITFTVLVSRADVVKHIT